MSKNVQNLSCFKAYDIRGKLGEELNEEIAYDIGRAYALHLKPKTIVVGGDVRETSEALKLAVAKGLQDGGVDVIDIGMVGTEEIYFATSYLKVDGGIEVTASHNPIDYNGMKLVKEQSKPISGDTGLNDIKALVKEKPWLSGDVTSIKKGSLKQLDNLLPYVEHLMTYIEPTNIKPLKLVVNSGNGAAGHVIDELENQFKKNNIPVEFIKVHHQPDSSFPNGIPNPLLPENRSDTEEAVLANNADMGIAWDGDFDRCFLFDEKGQFIEGYYIVGLLAEAFLQKNSNERIIYDPRVYWNTEDIVTANAGTPVMSKTGHAFIKERMRKEDAVYGGEMSAHHYFRDFAYCDSGMIPWLLVAELLSVKNQPISAMVKDRIEKYPSSGEINQKVKDPISTIQKIENIYSQLEDVTIDYIDGVDIRFPEWRFNLRISNTEPVIRLNVEAKGNKEMMEEKTELLQKQINEEKKNATVGCIDGIDSKIIHGWVAILEDNPPLNIGVFYQGEVIAEGCADIYREDLKEAGINDGKHAFNIPISFDFPQKQSAAIFTLINLDTQEPIEGISFEVEYSDPLNKFNATKDLAERFFDEDLYNKNHPGVWGWEHYAHYGQYESKLPNNNVIPEVLDKYFRTDNDSIPLVQMLDFAKKQEGVLIQGAPVLSIVILNWNKSLMTLQCVYTLFKNSYNQNIEVIVVDNGSRDNEFSKLIDLRAHPRVKIVRNKSNRFYGEANNIGVEAATSETICLLNNDAFVGPDWDRYLLEELNSDEKVGGVGPKFLYPNGVLQEAGGEINPCGQNVQIGKGLDANLSFFNRNADVTHISAACFILSKELYYRINGFDYTYEPAYYEDADLTAKISVLGYKIRYVSNAEVIHVENATSKEPGIGFDFGSLISTNRMKFVEKWGDYLRNGDVPIIPDFTQEYQRELSLIESSKIAVVYSPYNLTPGGGERYVLSLALAAKESGYTTYFCSPEKYSKFRLHTVAYALGLDVSGLNLIGEDDLDGMHNVSLFIAMSNELSPSIKARGMDKNIYHCQFPFPMSDWHQAHCLINVMGYDKVVVNSQFTKENYEKEACKYYIDIPPVVVVSPPVEMIENIGKPNDGVIRVLNVGRFIAGGHCKKQKELVTAYNKLHKDLMKQNIKSKFTLMGSLGAGEQDRNYLEQVRQLAGPGVEIILNGTRELIIKKYQESDFYWHGTGIGENVDDKPEVFEHFGITPVEAISAGCKPIVWKDGGPQEVLLSLGLDEKVCIANKISDYSEKTIESLSVGINVDVEAFSEECFYSKLKKVVNNEKT